MTVEPLEKPVDALQAAHPMEDFDWSTQPEPHASRRKAIMEKYPQVRRVGGIGCDGAEASAASPPTRAPVLVLPCRCGR